MTKTSTFISSLDLHGEEDTLSAMDNYPVPIKKNNRKI